MTLNHVTLNLNVPENLAILASTSSSLINFKLGSPLETLLVPLPVGTQTQRKDGHALRRREANERRHMLLLGAPFEVAPQHTALAPGRFMGFGELVGMDGCEAARLFAC